MESTQDFSHTELSQTCAICDCQAAKKRSETPILDSGSIFYLGTVYHKLDFIYILNEQNEDALYKIGQILSFSQDNTSNTIQVQIRQLKHYDNFAEHGLNSIAKFNLANWMNDEVCYNNFTYFSFTYIAILASSLLHNIYRNYSR